MSAQSSHVYLVITTSWRDGPVWGVFGDAWDALDAVRRYPDAERLMSREVGADEHTDGVIYSGLMRGGEAGGRETVVQVRRVPVQRAHAGDDR